MNHPRIYYETFKYKESQDLREFITSPELRNLVENTARDVIIVLGWDGTMLKAAKKYFNQWKKFLWINFWNKWFLLNSRNIIGETEFVEKNLSLLSAKIQHNDKTTEWIALNEINIQAAWWQILTLDINSNTAGSIQIAWDGILISTPTGSTGHNASLGWPILPHSNHSFIINPKAPFSPKWQPPIIIDDTTILTIKDIGRQNGMSIYLDWQAFIRRKKDVKLMVKKHSRDICLLIGKKELNTWNQRVFQEQGFKQFLFE